MLLDEGCDGRGPAADLSLTGNLLAPDRERRFQRKDVEASALHRRLVDAVGERFAGARPRVILCCGKCRVGSTALANVFGHADMPALYQPMKTLLRYMLVQEPCPAWRLAGDQPVIFLKETFGPYVTAECTFSPLQVLLDAGFRAHDITLLIMERHPLATMESWRRCWHDRIGSDEFAKMFYLASINAHRTARIAAAHDIEVAYYVHEASIEPDIAVSSLFDTLGLQDKFDVSILRNWTAGDTLRGAQTAVTFFRQPNDYWIDDIHLDLSEYRYVRRHREGLKAALWQGDAAHLDQLDRLYRQTRERARGGRPN